jgi:hypothetical protein
VTDIDRALEREVRRRAGSACEYCRMPESAGLAPSQIDHVIAQQHGGLATLDNLALARLRCNKHKGPNIAGLDPVTRRVVRLFNPRRDRWAKHFAWEGPLLVGLTSIGRVTIGVLAINLPSSVAARAALIEAGLLPAAES